MPGPAKDVSGGPEATTRLRSFYALEAAGDPSLDDPAIADYRGSIEALRQQQELPPPGLDSFDAWSQQLKGGRFTPPQRAGSDPYTTRLAPQQEQAFQAWKQQYAPRDSGADYDLRGAFLAGLTPDPTSGHWSDRFKKPNHPTFSDQSQYAPLAPERAGRWNGETYVPAGSSTTTTPVTVPGQAVDSTAGLGAMLGSVLGGGGGAALGAGMGPASLIVSPVLGVAGARTGARLGEAAQTGVERLLGRRPSTIGTVEERMQPVAGPAGMAELGAQALGVGGRVVGAGVRALRSMTPTAKAAATGVAQMGRELAGAKALQEAETLGPRVRKIGQRAVDAAESTQPFDPIGRFRSTKELIDTMRPLIKESPIDVVRVAGRNPDVARALMTAATSDAERTIISQALEAASVAGQTARPLTLTPRSSGLARAIGRRTAGAAVGGALGASLGGVPGAALGIALEPAAEAVIRRVGDRVLNSPTGIALASGLAQASSAALRPATQTLATSMRR